MFGLFGKKKPDNSNNITLVLKGMHCTSCAVNIDLTLEELPGVVNSKTNYAKSVCEVAFDPEKVTPERIREEINKLGYLTQPV